MRHSIDLAVVLATWLGALIPPAVANSAPAPILSSPETQLCPEPCYKTGPNPSNWTVFSDIKLISGCMRPMLLDVSPGASPSQNTFVRGCDTWGAYYYFSPPPKISAVPGETETKVTAQLAWSPPGSKSERATKAAVTVLREVEYQLQRSATPWGKTILFGVFQGTTVGVYIGDNMLDTSAVDTLFKPLVDKVTSAGIGASRPALLQVCGDKRTSDKTFGVIVMSNGNLGAMQDATRTWAGSNCVNTTTFAQTAKLDNLSIRVKPRFKPQTVVPANTPLPATGSLRTDGAGTLRAAGTGTGTGTGTGRPAMGTAVTGKARGGATTSQSQPTPNKSSGEKEKPRSASVVRRDGTRTSSAEIAPKPTEKKVTNPTEKKESAASRPTGSRGTVTPTVSTGRPARPTGSPTKPKTEWCETMKVFAGDNCDSLAKNCQISRDQLIKFNPRPDLCKSAQEGQHVCCSEGRMPDLKPQMNPDGSCFVYEVKAWDRCESIAAAFGLEVRELDRLNDNTWGWPGCKPIRGGLRICLSKGHPPFPAPISNAVCGPQKPGTPVAPPGTDLSTLNPCPLNACCNTMGQCGVTDDFCISTQGSGSPGTGKNGTVACISNCDNFVQPGDAPKKFIRMAYFDAFNLNRDCANMDISQINTSYYTHVHLAFGQVKPDFDIGFGDEASNYMFKQFKNLRGAKRILSLGGWTYSPKELYLPFFRDGIKADKRDVFAASIARFADAHVLDGIDIVWEMPGSPTVPGGPPRSNPNEGADYAAFLKVLRSKLHKDKTLSVAAPASYWHLMQFPIVEISRTVDYIVYMTNNLQSQWDSIHKWSDPSCPTNNCVRSPINKTETYTALSILTRAGVPSAKIVVALTSYARTFTLADPSCGGPECFFKGRRGDDSSLGGSGGCMAVNGHISNAEIDNFESDPKAKHWYDKDSDSMFMKFDVGYWVSYMTRDIKEKRTTRFKNLNLGGTADFPIDLERTYPQPGLVNWETLRHNIKTRGKPEVCDWELRTGTWVNRSCTQDEVAAPFNYTSLQRWTALEADAAWNDAKARWMYCDKGQMSFTQSVTQFFHANENAKCRDLAQVDSCDPIATCEEHNKPGDAKKHWTGAASYLVWNSLATVHAILKNYQGSLRDATLQVQNQKMEFLDTFAPDGTDKELSQGLSIALTILNAPLQILMTYFFKGFLANTRLFKAGDVKKNELTFDILKDTAGQTVSTGLSVASRFFKPETVREVDFSFIYNNLIKTWSDQVDALVVQLYDGTDESLVRLGNLIRNGNMAPGGSVTRETRSVARGLEDHSDGFKQSRLTERVFYSAAIPYVWRMRRPYNEYPVILDWGPDCSRDVGSGNWWFRNPQHFNDGYVCLNNHNYMLASTFDRNNTGPNCSGEYVDICITSDIGGPLWTPPGLKSIQKPDMKYGNVTVEDLVAGAVNTWIRNGKRNLMNPSAPLLNPLNKEDFQNMWDNGIRAPGHIHIPVCSPQEATQLSQDGTNHVPKENWDSFPCLRDPHKGYTAQIAEWWQNRKPDENGF
ncbi:hypothetical protein E4U41_006179 [Claviceps citrina]|nr:hypothetical protein E4U41_006179 [Claviceps citrina]